MKSKELFYKNQKSKLIPFATRKQGSKVGQKRTQKPWKQ